MFAGKNSFTHKPQWSDISHMSSIHYRFSPAGNTDSEEVFCAILNALNAKFDSFPSLADLYSTIEELCMEIKMTERY